MTIGPFVRVMPRDLCYGRCNDEHAAARAVQSGGHSRAHPFLLIGRDIQRGAFTGTAFALMPPRISALQDRGAGGRWVATVDCYINDRPLQERAVAALRRRDWHTGFSVALPTTGEPGIDLGWTPRAFLGGFTQRILPAMIERRH